MFNGICSMYIFSDMIDNQSILKRYTSTWFQFFSEASKKIFDISYCRIELNCHKMDEEKTISTHPFIK